MTPDRFVECLLVLRWSPVILANMLQCGLEFIEAMESGREEVPPMLANWLEALAQQHEAIGIPGSYGDQAIADTGGRRTNRIAA